jgi:hypothetical protein
VMIRRAFDTPQSVAESFLCLETWVSYVLNHDTTGTAMRIPSGVVCRTRIPAWVQGIGAVSG